MPEEPVGFVKPTGNLVGDVIGTHHGLRSHGRFRSLVVYLSPDSLDPASCRYIPERSSKCRKRVPLCNRAVKQGGMLNGELEN